MHATLRLLRPALAFMALGLAGRAAAQSGSKDSPFMPPASVTAASSPSENLEFAGVSNLGAKTLVNVYDKTLKKGRWISVGGTEGSLSVLAYDSRREQIVVKSAEGQKTLTLRKATGVPNAPSPVAVMPPPAGFNVAPDAPLVFKNQPAPAPVVESPLTVVGAAPSPANTPVEATSPKSEGPAKPLTVARQEEEARMLVSDLLEIGMAQRKAYEEAQKKASADPAAPPAAPAPGG